jgi:sarcosine oxidase subunit beta
VIERADVAVIGAGAIGLAVALYLRRNSVSDVVVVDANPAPGMGSTGRANGGVRAQFTTPINIEFSKFTIAGLADLNTLTGGQVGFHTIGYLLLTGSASGLEALQRAYTLQRSLGVDVTWLSAGAALKLAPFINADGLLAATYGAGDGVVDPHGVVGALWEQGRRVGVRYLFDTMVRAVDARDAKVIVGAAATTIEAEYAVNAAGPRARDVAALAGVELPVTNYKRNLACTERVQGLPADLPMCVDVDTGVLIRREGDGILIGFSDPSDAPSDDASFDPAFLDAVASRISNRFAFLEQVPIARGKCWAGLYPETSDHHAIIDAPATAPRFIQCAGFGGHGIMHCLAAGQAVAELIRDGRCTTFDLRPLRFDRRQEPGAGNETMVL